MTSDKGVAKKGDCMLPFANLHKTEYKTFVYDGVERKEKFYFSNLKEYNQDGKETRSVFDGVEYNYEYNELGLEILCVSNTLDEDGMIQTTKCEREYDKNNNLIIYRVIDGDKIIQTNTFDYDSKGRRTHYKVDGGSKNGKEVWYEYNERGDVIWEKGSEYKSRLRCKSPDDTQNVDIVPGYEFRMSYSYADDKIVYKSCINADGVTTCKTYLAYDANGKLIRVLYNWKFPGKFNAPYEESFNKYNKECNDKEYIFKAYDENLNELPDREIRQTWEYDENGYLISSLEVDSDGYWSEIYKTKDSPHLTKN